MYKNTSNYFTILSNRGAECSWEADVSVNHFAKTDPRVQTCVALPPELSQHNRKLMASCAERCSAQRLWDPLAVHLPAPAHSKPRLQCPARCRLPCFGVFHPFSAAAPSPGWGGSPGEKLGRAMCPHEGRRGVFTCHVDGSLRYASGPAASISLTGWWHDLM